MPGVVGLDIGTSTIKLSRRAGSGGIVTERVAPTPSAPIEIMRVVDRLLRDAPPGVVGLSAFRRALVVDDRTLVLARSSPPEPVVRVETGGRLDVLNPLAPIHRWADSVRLRSGRFQTFDVWLAERLTGRPACAESLAWLTGAWDTTAGSWDERVCAEARIPPGQLPDVLTEPLVTGGICLPVLGDHEATARACASAGAWPLRVAECGTALACMIGGGPEAPPRLGLESPVRCGYAELVDPHFARRVQGLDAPPLAWSAAASPSPGEVVAGAFGEDETSGAPIVLCGGNATPGLAADLTAAGFDVLMDGTLTSSAGALIIAERAAQAGGSRP
ncbi:hypothetical protein AGRA3207_002089 [Actinomadura graeca]|uniref:Carbohydrate kinase FGGY N-terminal domain-containing protein n=1 Tax=Actinomadura graeca TaxID=2750812 RepID=A0ABX8QUZ1_9ACTN|nr:hypothetical protein [Actinomadura graeca]QXJ21252.1 hypothetical protein AGRA3207_002089 [Actinomadura graeca]